MRKTICRTITATKIESANVTFEKGQAVVVKNPLIIISGNVTEEKALKEIRKTHGPSTQIISISQVDEVYEISVEDFIKNAKKVEVLENPADYNPDKEEE